MIEKFWSGFLDEIDELSKDNPSSDSMNLLLENLNNIDSRLYYHLGRKDHSIDLILSAEGNTDLMAVIDQIIANSPIVEAWGFVPAFDGLALFGERNTELYPDTANGDALFGKVGNGDKPWIPRPIDFNVVFPTRRAADQFGEALQKDGYKSEISAYDGAPGHTHEAYVQTEMTATLVTIEKFEAYLAELASQFGGRNDGWGCFNA